MSSAQAVPRTVVFADACGSGRLGLDAKRRDRAVMYAATAEAYASVGVEPVRMHQEDRGDGILTALPPDLPPTLMVGRWVDTLYESLRELNAGRARPLRLRVGMHAGLVLDDGRGLVGRAVDLACRLCDSDPAKQIMARAERADLLLVVSDWLYANVVAEGGRYVEPDCYRQAMVRNKETEEKAWFHIPRWPEPPLGDRAADGAGGGPEGDGPPPRPPTTAREARPPGGERHYSAQGDMQIFQGNQIHGGFTGIRKDRGTRGRREGDGT
ncbi:hypothetical protein [Streptomyces sp. PR69]|uniref:hypothetical protein n=1 Tax=Streptomyces sp. PR69 TaxID=2984950 RepID=UPI00226496BB|nr:hypothetical protein [Streptomyces sp. PR69]